MKDAAKNHSVSGLYDDSTSYTESFCVTECIEFTITDASGDEIRSLGDLTWISWWFNYNGGWG